MSLESSKLVVFLSISGAISASSLDLTGEQNVQYIGREIEKVVLCKGLYTSLKNDGESDIT